MKKKEYLFPLFNNLEQNSLDLYKIINNMKKKNKYFECELNRKIYEL